MRVTWPSVERVSCNLCGGDRTRLLLEEWGLSIVACRRCGLVYVNPRPTPEALLALYTSAEYVDGVRLSQPVSHAEELVPGDLLTEIYTNRARQELARLGKGPRVNTELIGWLRMLEMLKQQQPSGRLLDVGCGQGWFLKLASERYGYETFGLEPSPRQAEICRETRGLSNIACGALDDADYPDEFFDIITLQDVIEHFPDPMGSLRNVHRFLKPGGLILIKTPNVEYLLLKVKLVTLSSRLHRWFMGSLASSGGLMMPQEHLYNFSQATLRAYLRRSGFELVSSEPFGNRVQDSGLRSRLTATYDKLSFSLYRSTLGSFNRCVWLVALGRKVAS